jgi:hypothetical protein
MINENRKLSNLAEGIDHHVRFVGGAAAVEKVADTGQGITVAYIGTGVVELTWLDNPGMFVDAHPSFHAATPANVKGFRAVFGEFNASTLKLRVYLYEDAGDGTSALADLAASEWCGVVATFKRSGTGV